MRFWARPSAWAVRRFRITWMRRVSAAGSSYSIRPTDAKASRVRRAGRRSARLPWSSVEPTIARGANDGSRDIGARFSDFVGNFDHGFHALDIVHAHHVHSVENGRSDR